MTDDWWFRYLVYAILLASSVIAAIAIGLFLRFVFTGLVDLIGALQAGTSTL